MASVLAPVSTVTVNAAFLQEIKEDNIRLHQIFDETRRFVDDLDVIHAQCLKFCDLLGEIRDQLALHFSLEEAFGYLDDAVVEAPRLSEQAGCLRAEHGELFQHICRVADRADALTHSSDWQTVPRVIGRQFLQFDQALQAHERAENELILQAFDDDIGIGD